MGDTSTPGECEASPEVSEPAVSVVMVMRNAGGTVWKAIRSLQLQTLRDWELLLFDDGSTDDSVKVAASFSDSRIHIVTDENHGGLAKRLNQAVAAARAPLIARMDADDVCFPERLETQVAFLQDHPSVDLVGCGAAVFTDDGALIGLLPISKTHTEIVAAPSRGFSLSHPTWCGRTRWFRKNSYDSTLFRAQDQDLLLRSYSHSSFAAIPDVLLGYRQQRLELPKMLRGRAVYVGSLWRHGHSVLPLSEVWVGIASHVVKGMIDIATVGLGLNRFSQRQRLDPVPQAVRRRWGTLWPILHLHDRGCRRRPSSTSGITVN